MYKLHAVSRPVIRVLEVLPWFTGAPTVNNPRHLRHDVERMSEDIPEYTTGQTSARHTRSHIAKGVQWRSSSESQVTGYRSRMLGIARPHLVGLQ